MANRPIVSNSSTNESPSAQPQATVSDLESRLRNCNMQVSLVEALPTPTEEEMMHFKKRIFCKVFAPFFISLEVFKEEIGQIWKNCKFQEVEALKGGIFMIDIPNDKMRSFVVQNSPWVL